MKEVRGKTDRRDIFMAGDVSQARQVCREFCYEIGLCVHVHACDYVYTGGEEAGFKVGLLYYPRFPETPIDKYAIELAERLADRLCQHSFLIVGPEETIWRTRRSSEP